jgi:hypothetical protein
VRGVCSLEAGEHEGEARGGACGVRGGRLQREAQAGDLLVDLASVYESGYVAFRRQEMRSKSLPRLG